MYHKIYWVGGTRLYKTDIADMTVLLTVQKITFENEGDNNNNHTEQ